MWALVHHQEVAAEFAAKGAPLPAAWRLDVGWSERTGPFLNEVEAVGADWLIWGTETPLLVHNFTMGAAPCIVGEIASLVDEEMTIAQHALLQSEMRGSRSRSSTYL